jgi:hypothetical protein
MSVPRNKTTATATAIRGDDVLSHLSLRYAAVTPTSTMAAYGRAIQAK